MHFEKPDIQSKIKVIINKLNKQSKKDAEEAVKNESVEVIPNYKRVSDFYAEQLKPLERKAKIKHYLTVAFVIIGLIGGIKALFPIKTNSEALTVSEMQTFVKTYASNYFTYPSNDELTSYFSLYSLDSNWKIQYDSQKITAASANNIEIYKVTPDAQDARFADYYLYLTQDLALKDGSTKQTTFNVKIRLFNTKDDGYLVTEPVMMRSLAISNVGEDIKKSLVPSFSKGSEQANENEKKDVSDTISLFLDTYSNNHDQAQLLVDLAEPLDHLDAHTKLSFDALSSVTKDSTTYFVEASIHETLDDVITNNKKMHFAINIENNKIIEMEEY